MEVDENYITLRNMVLTLAEDEPEDLPPTKDGMYAFLMDVCQADYIYTLAAISDGTASLYFSNGGGIIGAGEHPTVRTQAFELLDLAKENQKFLSKTAKFPFPKVNFVSFFLITKDCIYSAEAAENDLGNNKVELSGLFHGAHKLISAIRFVTENKSKAQ